MVRRRKKGFFTAVGEFVRGEPTEITEARQKAFREERAKQAVVVGRERAKLQAREQLRRERERLRPRKQPQSNVSLFDVPVRRGRRFDII